MLHPIRSAYFGYKREEFNTSLRLLDENLHKACRLFSRLGIATNTYY